MLEERLQRAPTTAVVKDNSDSKEVGGGTGFNDNDVSEEEKRSDCSLTLEPNLDYLQDKPYILASRSTKQGQWKGQK